MVERIVYVTREQPSPARRLAAPQESNHKDRTNPADLAVRGIADGDRVRVTSRVGSVDTVVVATEDLMPGVVSLPHGYGHGGEGVLMAHASTVEGVSINDLTDPERLDVSGNAALSGVPVTVSAVPG